MGVHISLFGTPLLCCPKVCSAASDYLSTSSTNIDSWQLAQLRTMKVGGNGSTIDVFTDPAARRY
jgi:hypothetical protein